MSVYSLAVKYYALFATLIKGPFRDPQPNPPFFSKKVEIFTSGDASRYIMFVCKIFLANLFICLAK